MKPFLCPDDQNKAPTIDVNFGGADDPPKGLTSYAPNFNIFTTYISSGKYLGGKYEQAQEPAKTMMFMDSDNISAWNTRYIWSGKDKTLLDVYNQYSGGQWEEVFPFDRHVKSRLPLLYVDGHAEQIRMGKISPLRNVYTSKNFNN